MVYGKSKDFALQIVRLYKKLTKEENEFVISKQILRSATSIGANTAEGLFGESRIDFAHKLNIAVKEAAETWFWLDILKGAEYISKEEWLELATPLHEIIAMMVASIKTLRRIG